MTNAGVLTKVEHLDWATPIVPILKADRSVRICGDYKAIVNSKLIIDEYPLPTTDELFVKLAGGGEEIFKDRSPISVFTVEIT